MKSKLLYLVAVCCFLFSSCGSGTGSGRFAWPLASSSPENTVTHLFAEEFARRVSELSSGRMRIQVYSNSVLGGDRELLESCKDGDIPFIVQTTAPQVPFMKDLAIFDLPVLFDDINDVRDRVDDSLFLFTLNKVYDRGGYELLGIADQGFRVMSTNRFFDGISSLRGQKIRTMENPYHLQFWRCLGASPTPMAFSEVYVGLQQGTIDAQENPLEVIFSNHLYEQQKYIVETDHLPHLVTLVASSAFMGKLSEEDREIIRRAALLARDYARMLSDERIASRKDLLKDKGILIQSPDSLARGSIRTLSEPVYEAVLSKVDRELAKRYMGEK